MKTIFRSTHREHFTMLPNALLRDRTISLRARGLLAMALSNAVDWVVTKAWVEEQVPEGREAIRTAFRELESAGYAVMTEQRDLLGKIVSRTWTFYDTPVPVSDRSNSTETHSTKNPTQPSVNGDNNPSGGNTHCGKPAAKKEQGSSEGTSSDTIAVPAKEALKKPRPRDPVFDALAALDGWTESNPLTNTGSGRVAKAKADIMAACPDVIALDIEARADVYRETYPFAKITSTALAAHWAACDPSGDANKGEDWESLSHEELKRRALG